ERPADEDPWTEVLDAQAAHVALLRLSLPQRMALTLRYLDGLPVPEVARHLDRSVHATETLLVRARAALRRVYQEGEHHAA
ncbi:MAG: RNA polymerase sigma factor, partial [Solirubrobacteraceae bacterium]